MRSSARSRCSPTAIGMPNTAMLGSLGTYATLFKFSRDMEREADRLGFQVVVAKGYDPRAGADLWGRMLREENTLKYISTQHGVRHPPGDRRNASTTCAPRQPRSPIRRRCATPRSTAPRRGRSSRTGWWRELAQRRYASSQLVIQELLDDAPPEDRGMLTFYLGEAYRRRDAAGDRREGRATSMHAPITLPGTPAAAWREHGFALAQSGPQRPARACVRTLSADARRRPTTAPSCSARSTSSEARTDASMARLRPQRASSACAIALLLAACATAAAPAASCSPAEVRAGKLVLQQRDGMDARHVQSRSKCGRSTASC